MAEPKVFQFTTPALKSVDELRACLQQLGAKCVFRKTDADPELWYGYVQVAAPANELRRLLGMPATACVELTEHTFEEMVEALSEGPVELDLVEDNDLELYLTRPVIF